jgi:hypothetical protein
MEMKKWAGKVKRTLKEEGGGGRRGRRQSINLAIVSANNHYTGFGPGTANIFKKMVGLPEAQFSKEESKKDEDDKSYLHGSSIQDDSKQSTI